MGENDNRVTLASQPKLSHLLETSLYVADLAAAQSFYQRVFGLETIFADHRMCAMALPASAVLLLFKIDGSVNGSNTPGGSIPGHGGIGHQHVCFAIPLASLDSWSAHLGAESIAIESRVKQYFGGISLYFRDPDGHSVEVATPGLWPNY